MRTTTIGRFDRRIAILTLTEAVTDFNTGERSWSQLAQVWSKIDQPLGTELNKSEQQIESRNVVFNIRYRTDVKTEMRIAFDGRVYVINSISEPSIYRKQVLQILAELMPDEVYEIFSMTNGFTNGFQA